MQLFKQLKYLLCFIPILALGQSSVKGTVIDSQSNESLPGVNITVEKKGLGTVTDFDGNFILEKVELDDILTFSYIGYRTQEIEYIGQPNLSIAMEVDDSSLQEVVLIGYGSATKEDVTAAVAKVSEKDFNQGAITSPEQLIAAKTPGVRVTSAGGAPGAGSQIRIRQGSSLNASSDPLIVVDGIPLEQDRNLQGSRNPLNAINPREIQDFVILKDAAATAIYGSRGSNGVILITTKKADRNTGWKLDVDVKGSYGLNTNEIDVLDGNAYTQFVNEFAASAGGNPEQFLRGANTNWQDEIFQNSRGVIYDATVSKGWKNTTFRLNSNTNIQRGALLNDEYKRSAWNLAVNQFLLNNDLKLTLTSKNSFSRNRFANNDAISSALRFNPTNPVFDANGNFFEERDSDGNIEVNAPGNPLGILQLDDNRVEGIRSITNLNIDYKIPYVPGLRFTLNTGFDYAEAKDGRQFQPGNSGLFKNNFDNLRFYNGINRNQLLDFFFNYKKKINPINTVMDVTAGYSYQDFFESNFTTRTNNGELVDEAPIIRRNRLIGYLGRASFNIASKYLISGSVRRDLSSRFSEDNRVGIFPGASLGWKLHNEKFLKDSKVISQLKLRAGWGITGQQELTRDVFSNDLPFLPLIVNSEPGASVQFGNNFVPTARIEATNRDLKWEETETINYGLDFGLFDNRITGSVEYYKKETDDLLSLLPAPAGTTTSDFLIVNAASTKSEGVEFGINADIIRNENFKWNAGFNLTYQDREITKLNLSDDDDFFIPQGGIAGGTGNTIQIFQPGFDPTTFFTFRQIYDDNGRPIEGAYVDVNGDNQISEADRIASKDATPDFLAGFTSTFEYKNVDLNFTLRGNFGAYNYNNVQSFLGNVSNALITSGDFIENTTTDIRNSNFQAAQFFSDYYLEKADFVRLDNITLGYNLQKEKLRWRFTLTANNLFTITDYSGIDPELFVTDAVGGAREGIDDKFYPRQTSLVLGVNMKF